VVVADDGTSPVGSDEWNAAHVGICDTQSQPAIDQTVRAFYSARIDGMPLVIASGFMVSIAAGGLLVLAP
jgi:glyoxylate carboligase